jgi:hypothetical protein
MELNLGTITSLAVVTHGLPLSIHSLPPVPREKPPVRGIVSPARAGGAAGAKPVVNRSWPAVKRA